MTAPLGTIGHVYVMQSGPYFKIGYSRSHPTVRLETIQTASPQAVYLLGFVAGAAQHEKHLHKVYAAKRVHGEWFTLSREDVDQILSGSLEAPEAAQPPSPIPPATARQQRILAFLSGGHSETAQDIAARTGIPYETMRPELLKLIKSGQIIKKADGLFSRPPSVRHWRSFAEIEAENAARPSAPERR